MGEIKRIQWRGDNEQEVFDFARPFAFQDYTAAETPMRLRRDVRGETGSDPVPIGAWIVRTGSRFMVESETIRVR